MIKAASVSLQNVCFVSWAFPPSALASLVPDGVELDTFDGQSYVTAVAIQAREGRFVGLPRLPRFDSYRQLNFRTYVTYNGERAIWWLSVDGTPGAAMPFFAKKVLRIPYVQAQIRMKNDGADRRFGAWRGDTLVFDLDYRIDLDEAAIEPADGSHAQFICERDIAFSQSAGRIWRLEVRHPSWAVQSVTDVRADAAGLFEAHGIPVPQTQPVAYYAPRSDGDMFVASPATPRRLRAAEGSRTT